MNIKQRIKTIISNIRSLTERSSITFNNETYPRDGWAVFTAGGPGSGKSFTIKNQFMIEGKVLDSDVVKVLYIHLLQKLLNDPDVSNEEKNKLLEPFEGHVPNLKNPHDMDNLHKYTSWKKHFFTKVFDSFLKSSGKSLQNVIIDTTGNNLSEIVLNANLLKEMGYKVSMVWVITNINLAKIRNKTRDRTVPDDYLEYVHNKLLNSIPESIRAGLLDRLDELWIVLGSDNKSNNFKEKFANSVFKLEKGEGTFKLSDEMLQKITLHAGIKGY